MFILGKYDSWATFYFDEYMNWHFLFHVVKWLQICVLYCYCEKANLRIILLQWESKPAHYAYFDKMQTCVLWKGVLKYSFDLVKYHRSGTALNGGVRYYVLWELLVIRILMKKWKYYFIDLTRLFNSSPFPWHTAAKTLQFFSESILYSFWQNL